MGSTLVATMAEEPKRLHPFFAAPRGPVKETEVKDAAVPAERSANSSDPNDEALANADAHDEDGQRRKRRKTTGSDAPDDEQTPKRRPGRPRKKDRVSLGADITNHFVKLGEDVPALSEDCSKRDEEPQISEDMSKGPLAQAPESALNTADATPVKPDYGDDAPQKQPEPPKPKKLLIFNPKTGTIGSPPKPKSSKQGLAAETGPQSAGRKKQSRIACIKYGVDEESRRRIGALIGAVLDSPAASTASKGQPGSKETTVETPRQKENHVENAAKATHPFFAGKAQNPHVGDEGDGSTKTKATEKQEPPRPKMYSSTPCSPKNTRQANHSFQAPQFGIKPTGLRIPGAKLPAWPWKDMVHVRGKDTIASSTSMQSIGITLPLRKSKGNTIHIPQNESVLARATCDLDVPGKLSAARNIDADQFLPPPPELRLPKKHVESGRKLQSRIASELVTSHPALARIRDSIRTGLSAFDRSQCESQCWTQKYAPISAAEVLQPGKEAFLLRGWLEALRVQAIDTGSAEGDQSRPGAGRGGSRADGAAKKKRRRNKLNGFIVDSDEEADEMDEISEDEAESSPNGAQARIKKTVVRAGSDTLVKGSKDRARLANSVVISGPHGCGKTAAVYAVAKELNYEVFEISPNSRRSGKDVMEKIGDMTRNHLVQHQAGGQEADDDTAIQEDEVSMDIKSGRQATMIAFFKAKPAAKVIPRPKKLPEQATPSRQSAAKKAPSKNQKQSLILLEEVDILYEEDKQFWATVIGLIAQSKRPCVMTCNDEALVPLQALNLHGIFRFSPPLADVAVDNLVLIAANEGHALCREAVTALYEARDSDFRASLMDLNYWCQIGVGDRRGGFEWFYPRWPKGVDLDENNEVVRVVSEGTYQQGMGWLGHDGAVDASGNGPSGEQLLQDAWDGWQLDLGQWQDSLDLVPWAEDLKQQMETRDGRLGALQRYEDFADAMSAADVSSSMAFAVGNQV